MHADIAEILYSEDEISERVSQLGKEITADYRLMADAGEDIVLVCLLKGAATFMADLARKIQLPAQMDYMVVSSYGDSAKSSGNILVKKDLDSDIAGKHVLVVEDIIDSGMTLSYLLEELESRNPRSLEVVALLQKKTDAQKPVDCKYVGFECPNRFIVGYGLDYAQRYRNLSYIGVLREEVYS